MTHETPGRKRLPFLIRPTFSSKEVIRMEKIVHFLSRALHEIAQVILFAMMMLVVLDVLGRWLFNSPIKGTVDLTGLLLTVTIFFGIAYTHWKKEHIAIDFIVDKFPKRVQWAFECVINLIILVFMTMVSVSLYQNAQRLLQSNTLSPDINVPIYIFVLLAIAGTVVFGLTALYYVVHYAIKVVKNA